jgi:transcriptional regulator with XRE-family HTH domain
MTLATRTRSLLTARGISVAAAATGADMARTTLIYILDGGMPRADKVVALAAFFGVSADYLLTGADDGVCELADEHEEARCCATCRWWDDGAGRWGWCRHHSPRSVDGPSWPTAAADDWCGDHKFKPGWRISWRQFKRECGECGPLAIVEEKRVAVPDRIWDLTGGRVKLGG